MLHPSTKASPDVGGRSPVSQKDTEEHPEASSPLCQALPLLSYEPDPVQVMDMRTRKIHLYNGANLKGLHTVCGTLRVKEPQEVQTEASLTAPPIPRPWMEFQPGCNVLDAREYFGLICKSCYLLSTIARFNPSLGLCNYDELEQELCIAASSDSESDNSNSSVDPDE